MKKGIAFFCAAFLLCANFFSQARNTGSDASSSSQTARASFLQALNAYSSQDWDSAQILLKNAAAYKENDTEEVAYMLVAAEMYSGNYTGALSDCERFLNKFPNGKYAPHINYQRGRALFSIGEYNDAILTLSDFCHENPEHELYPSALYWIAESFYEDYSYADAKNFFSRVINEFPDSEKTESARYKLDVIAQRDREDKLLYLLQQTGEEYLAAREEYERQLRTQSFEDAADADLRAHIAELQNKNSELEANAAVMQQIIDSLTAENMRYMNTSSEFSEDVWRLKLKAQQVQILLNERVSEVGE